MKAIKRFATAATLSALTAAAFAQDGRYSNDGATGPGSGMVRGSGISGEDPYYTAVRLIHHEKYAEAIPYLDAALAMHPRDANTLSYEGYAHTMTGEYTASLDYFQSALARDPDHKAAHQGLGELYLAMHNGNGAQSQLAELVRLCPDGCDERDALTKEIGAPVPAATSAAPASK